MSDLNKALKKYIKKTHHPTFSSFVRNNESIIKKWIIYYDDVRNAKAAFKNQCKSVYKQVYPKRKKIPAFNLDITSIYKDAKAEVEIEREGVQTLVESTRTASIKIRLNLNKARQEYENNENADAETEGEAENDSNNNNDSKNDTESNSDDDDDIDNNDNDNVEQDKLKKSILQQLITGHHLLNNGYDISKSFQAFKKKALKKSREQGLSVDENIHDILSLSHIMLLKENQFDHEMMKTAGTENLQLFFNDLKHKYIQEATSIDNDLFNNIINKFRNVDSTTSRKQLKIDLINLTKDANTDDDIIINILINCISKLPNYNLIQTIGEQELISTYIDPIVSPIFHDPTNHRIFRWLNRTTVDTKKLRPDGSIILTSQRHTSYALGYCEIKPFETEANTFLTHEDLLRLSIFCKNSLDIGEIQAMICFQVVGHNICFYLLTLEHEAIYVMMEICNIKVPKVFQELPKFVMEVDKIKQVIHCYNHYCIKISPKKNFSIMKRPSLSHQDLVEIINKKTNKRKRHLAFD